LEHNFSEQQLIKEIKNGNALAFRALYNIYSANVYNTALSFLKQKEEAEEVTQDVFIKIHKNINGFKSESTLKTWIYRITVNTCINYQKKNKLFNLFEFNKDKEDFEHPGVILENKEFSKMLFKVIDSLPENQKTAFILVYIEHLPQKEVAEIMETSVKAVESLLQRAKQNLKKKLKKIKY
jgi:RNA polymerase sigma-70 factor (ECF subfamily)